MTKPNLANSPPLKLRAILDTVYLQGAQDGEMEMDTPVIQDEVVEGAVQQIRRLIEDDFKKYFEANLLDGHNVHTESKGAMLNAQEVYEVISDYMYERLGDSDERLGKK